MKWLFLITSKLKKSNIEKDKLTKENHLKINMWIITKTWGNRTCEKLRICNNYNEDKKQRKRLHNEIAKMVQKTVRNKISEAHNRSKRKRE